MVLGVSEFADPSVPKAVLLLLFESDGARVVTFGSKGCHFCNAEHVGQ